MPAQINSPVAVRMLSGFSLVVGGEPVQQWRGGKARGMFQYLLLNEGKLVPREKLYEVLWPDADHSTGGSSLKVAAHALRGVLGRIPADAGFVLVCRDRGYQLQARDVWTDVAEFERCCATRADRAAMELYQDDFLGGDDSAWVVEQREWYRSLALRVLDRLREDALRRGDHLELMRWCRRSLDIDPYREDTYRALMSVHAVFGELDRVVAWYRLCLRRLQDGLGVDPSPETNDVLLRALRRGVPPIGPDGFRVAAPARAGMPAWPSAPGRQAGLPRAVRIARPGAA